MSTAALAPEKPLRLACNRCHAQKLRCPRSSESERNGPDEPCSRCRKAGAQCIVSTRGKVGRPAKRKPSSPASVEEPRHHNRHRQNSENASSNGSLIHVFGMAPESLLPGQLTPPDTDDHQRMCDADNMLSSTGSPCMTPTPQLSLNGTSTVSDDNNEVDPVTGWPSQHPWPNATFNVEPNCFSASESTMYEPFLQDINLDLELPTFNFTPEPTKMFNLAENMPALNEKDGDNLFHMFHDEPQGRADNTKSPNVPQGPTADLSRTASVLKLSDLSAKIIRSSERYRSNAPVNTPVEAETSLGQQIVKDIVDFSGELIDIARQGLPRFINPSQASVVSSASSDVDMSAVDEDDGPAGSATASVDTFTTTGSLLPAPCIPESAVIFLLLGCYTQLLHSFELAIDCLYAEHRSSTHASDDNPGTVNSLLKASLLIHTVTYLLGRVHRSFAAGEAGDNAVSQDLMIENV
ncbi:hypothetical protein AK830_g7853 [Neonectria ditissima]|uniref:Zn(2)-C6 fungal-type domain-containing protein n=1 Tax=Neonectria ditissima TaxID=78410 RepID=A0A0P7B980_9HYPO|nr:hypothetical protein AK830_g7853 [Neonectria ditissima]